MPERILIRYPLFELLDLSVIQALLENAVMLTFAAGEIIFQEGTAGAWLHLLMEGRVRVLKRSESGREISLGSVRECELFGEYVLLEPHLHTATSRAITTSQVLRLPLQRVLRTLLKAGIDSSLLTRFIRLHASMHFATGRHYLGFMPAPSALTYFSRLRREHFRALRTLCGPGLAMDRWFLILSGTAILTDGTNRSYELGPGDCFGSHCLTGRDTDETVSTITAIECLSLRGSEFRDTQSPESGCGEHEDEFSGENSGRTELVPSPAVLDFPFTAQCHGADCGLAALAMVLQYLGCSARDSLYREFQSLPEHGLSVLQLRNLAHALSFSAAACRIDVEHVQDLERPFIARLNNGHFVVVYDVNDRVALIADPATCLHCISLQQLQQSWQGYALVVRRRTDTEQ